MGCTNRKQNPVATPVEMQRFARCHCLFTNAASSVDAAFALGHCFSANGRYHRFFTNAANPIAASLALISSCRSEWAFESGNTRLMFRVK